MNVEPSAVATKHRLYQCTVPFVLALAGMALLGACSTSSGSAAGGPSGGTRSGSVSAAPSTPTPASTTSAPAAHGQTATVDLTFSGAVNGHLTGTGPGRCDYYDIVNDRGLDYEVNGKDFGQPALGLLQLSGVSATATPAAILNTETASYGWYPQDGGTVKLNGDRSGASIDAQLTKIASQDKVRVNGTVTCH